MNDRDPEFWIKETDRMSNELVEKCARQIRGGVPPSMMLSMMIGATIKLGIAVGLSIPDFKGVVREMERSYEEVVPLLERETEND